MKDFSQYLKIVNENTGAERLKSSNRAIDESELRMLKNMFAKSPNNDELGRRINDLESKMKANESKSQGQIQSLASKLYNSQEFDDRVADLIKVGYKDVAASRHKEFAELPVDCQQLIIDYYKSKNWINESMDQTFNDAEDLAAILIDTFKDIESLYPQMEAEIMNIVMSNPGHMYKQKIDEISRKFNIDRKLVEEAFSDFGCNINESDSGIIRLFKSRLMKEYIKDIDKNDIKTKSKNKTVKTSHRSDDYAINRVELKDGTVGYVWSDDQKLDESEETLGGLVPVQSGEVIKLQKPAPETYINKVMNNDNVEIADCTVCGADHVIVGEHICKTVLDTSDQVPSEFNMTESRFESLRIKYGYNENKMVTKIEWFKTSVLEKNTISNSDLEDMQREVKDLSKEYRTKMPAASSNQIKIKACKDIAKKYKISYTELLKLYKPDNNLEKDKTWDKNGNIK